MEYEFRDCTRRKLILGALTAPLLPGCSMSKYFVIGWSEQVLLQSGETIVVSVKYTYERLGTILNMNRYEPSILQLTDFSFGSDLQHPIFLNKFERHRVNTVQHINGQWYIVLEMRGANVYEQTAGGYRELFGTAEDDTGHKCFRLNGGGLTRISLDTLSDAYLRPNLLMDTAGAEKLSTFNNTLITLDQKAEYLISYPLDPYETRIKSRHESVTNR